MFKSIYFYFKGLKDSSDFLWLTLHYDISMLSAWDPARHTFNFQATNFGMDLMPLEATPKARALILNFSHSVVSTWQTRELARRVRLQ